MEQSAFDCPRHAAQCCPLRVSVTRQQRQVGDENPGGFLAKPCIAGCPTLAAGPRMPMRGGVVWGLGNGLKADKTSSCHSPFGLDAAGQIYLISHTPCIATVRVCESMLCPAVRCILPVTVELHVRSSELCGNELLHSSYALVLHVYGSSCFRGLRAITKPSK